MEPWLSAPPAAALFHTSVQGPRQPRAAIW